MLSRLTNRLILNIFLLDNFTLIFMISSPAAMVVAQSTRRSIMTNHNQNPITNPSLECLVFEAQNQLKVLGYHRRSQSRYQAVWRRYIEFAHRQPSGDGYSDELAVRFLAVSRPKEGVPLKPEEGWRQHSECCMKALRDYARFSRIERSVVDMQSLVVAPAMQKPLRDFEQFCRDRRHLRPSSLQERLREVALFLVYLSSERHARPMPSSFPPRAMVPGANRLPITCSASYCSLVGLGLSLIHI